MTPVAFVGDIHGEAARLERLLTRASLWKRTLILLGDYVNRGPASAAVLELLGAALGEGHVALLGNHDHAFLGYLEGRVEFVELATMGGAATIRSYLPQASGELLPQLRAAVPTSHIETLRALQTYWESQSILASHTGYNPQRPESRALEDVAIRGYPAIFTDDTPPADLVVCGHYTQRDGRAHVSRRLICLDTACGSGGPLTALLWPEREIVQF